MPLSEAERDALKRQHRRGLCDRDIAAELHRPWRQWTERKVRYWRDRLNLPHNGYNRRRRAQDRDQYAARHGWGHLLPSFKEIQLDFESVGLKRRKRVKLEIEGVHLTHRQVDILCALRNRGPQTRDELNLPRCYGPWDNLGRLIGMGLVERRLIKKGIRRVCLYGLTSAAGEHQRSTKEDGLDRRLHDPQRYR